MDACALVTKAEAEAVLGRSLDEPQRNELLPAGMYGCTWEDYDPDAPISVSHISTGVTDHGSAEAALGFWQMSGGTRIDGFGDGAWDLSPYSGLVVVKGRYDLSIEVRQAGYASDLYSAKQLAPAALARLS